MEKEEWWIDDKEPGESPLREKWYHDGDNIFHLLIVGVVGILWLTW